uniref:Ig-like domain-containing protein n=1 Tax=Meloidogyne hapla TaxID=6305 RepID=A0A1I8BTL9_MELHA
MFFMTEFKFFFFYYKKVKLSEIFSCHISFFKILFFIEGQTNFKNFRYRWLKDNSTFPVNVYRDRIVTNSDNGSLIFTKFSESDEGEYQCLASNDNGTAYSEKIKLLLAWINPFPDDFDRPEVVNVPLTRPYARDCTPPDSNPPAMIFWILRSPDNIKHISGINSSHISSNERVRNFFK